jgi:hypothetical protein
MVCCVALFGLAAISTDTGHDKPAPIPIVIEEVKAPAPPKLVRTWTSADGKFTTEAVLIKSNPNNATLEKSDGTRIDVKQAQLSENDRKYIHNRILGIDS